MKIRLPDGKQQRSENALDRFYGDWSLSDDGKEIVYVAGNFMPSNTIVLIENPLK